MNVGLSFTHDLIDCLFFLFHLDCCMIYVIFKYMLHNVDRTVSTMHRMVLFVLGFWEICQIYGLIY